MLVALIHLAVGSFYLCLQAGGGDVTMDVHDDRSLLALQGPAAIETLGPLTDLDMGSFYFSHFAKPEIAGIPCYLTRTGCVLGAACCESVIGFRIYPLC